MDNFSPNRLASNNVIDRLIWQWMETRDEKTRDEFQLNSERYLSLLSFYFLLRFHFSVFFFFCYSFCIVYTYLDAQRHCKTLVWCTESYYREKYYFEIQDLQMYFVLNIKKKSSDRCKFWNCLILKNSYFFLDLTYRLKYNQVSVN